MPLIISSHIMMVMWGHASLMAFATLVTWLRKSCPTVRPGEANHCFDSSPSPRMYTFRSPKWGWQRIDDWLSAIADSRRLVLTSSAPMCSVFRPGCSFTTCLSISITSLTPSALCGLRVPTQYGASLRFHMGRCFSTNYDIKRMAAGHWYIKKQVQNLRIWAFKSHYTDLKTTKQGGSFTSMWPNVCTSGMTSKPLDLANSCIDNISAGLEIEHKQAWPISRSSYTFVLSSSQNEFKLCRFWQHIWCSIMSKRAPISRMCRGLQQLQLSFIGKHVFILHQQAISSQAREQLDQLRHQTCGVVIVSEFWICMPLPIQSLISTNLQIYRLHYTCTNWIMQSKIQIKLRKAPLSSADCSATQYPHTNT